MACNGMASSFFPPNFLLQMQTPQEENISTPPATSLAALMPTTSCANPHDYHHGVAALLGKRRSMSFPGIFEACSEEMQDDFSDEYCSQLAAGESKKRRLSTEQVKTLEKNFEVGSKLEPERKVQLARALGLQPRQVAIWFQNRRARWKTKQLERDYDSLKQQFQALESENEALQTQNRKLQAEIMALKGGREPSQQINLNKETEVSCSDDYSSDANLDISRTPAATDSPIINTHQNRRPLIFQTIRPAVSVAPYQLLQQNHHMRSAELQCPPKGEHGGAGGQDENLCNIFCTIEDQSGFWNAWPEQQHFH